MNGRFFELQGACRRIGLMAASLAAAAGIACVGMGATAALAADGDAGVYDPGRWAEAYPDEYGSYMRAGYAGYSNDLVTGKVNALYDATHHQDYDKYAGCFVCHSSEMSGLVAEEGPGVVTRDFEELRDSLTYGITCYSCHGDDPSSLTVGNEWVLQAAEEGGIDTSVDNLVCAQCHAEIDRSAIYDGYDEFHESEPQTWYPALTYGNDVDKVWQYFVDEGYDDPKYFGGAVSNYLGSVHDKAGVTCAQCHMATVENDSGEAYTDHAFMGPDDNEALLQNCVDCHDGWTVDDARSQMQGVMDEFGERLSETQAVVDELGEALERAASDPSVSAGDLQEATGLYNKAKFYKNYGQDTSSGFHNLGGSDTASCLDDATAFAQEGLAILAK